MKKQLYIATINADVVFYSECKFASFELKCDAIKYLKTEYPNNMADRLKIKQISCLNDIPDDWKEAYLYGVDNKITAQEFFLKEDEEYQQYLKLKEKFEGSK